MRAPKLDSARLPLALATTAAIVLLGSTAAAFRSPADSAGNSVTAAPDFLAPTVSASAIGKSQGGATGFVKKGGTYFVYAQVGDSGKPPSGVVTASADLTALGGGASVPLSPGSFSAGGATYNYRSTQQTAAAGLTQGPVSYAIASVDGAANSGSSTWPATVDNTAPSAADVQTANGGGTTGKAEQGDTIAFSYSEPVEPGSILPGWDGSPTAVVVRVTTGVALLGGLLGQNEGLQVFDASNATPLPIGSVDLKRQYVAKTILLLSGTMTFGAAGTASSMALSEDTLTVTLGTHAGNNALTVTTPGAMEWGPATAPYDRAANAVAGTAASESGSADVEF